MVTDSHKKSFAGQFRPPAFGHKRRPFPIAGAGRIGVVDDGLVLVGKASRQGLGAFLGTLLTIACLGGGLALCNALNVDFRTVGKLPFLIGAALCLTPLLAFNYVWSRRALKGAAPLQIRVPWSAVGDFRVSKQCLIIWVTPKGTKGEVFFECEEWQRLLVLIESRNRPNLPRESTNAEAGT